jgi:hypothetical protein
MAKLDAMRLLDVKQSLTQNRDGEYRGSTTWVTPRGDNYMGYLHEVIIRKSHEKVFGYDDEKPIVDEPVTVLEPVRLRVKKRLKNQRF